MELYAFRVFFPQIASGPISKAKDLLHQINNEKRSFCYPQFVDGCRWLLWGMFLKVCVADRIGTIINPIYDNYIYYDGGHWLLLRYSIRFKYIQILQAILLWLWVLGKFWDLILLITLIVLIFPLALVSFGDAGIYLCQHGLKITYIFL